MPEDFAQRRQAALMRVGVSRMNALDSAAKANTEAHALAPVVASRLATLKTAAAVAGGVLLTATVARTAFKRSRKAAVAAAAAGAARRANPWGALALQLATAVAIPALRRYLAEERPLPPAGTARAPHPLGAVGSIFNLPRIDLNPARAFYRWIGLEK